MWASRSQLCAQFDGVCFMKLLIIQPKLEQSTLQLETELRNNPKVDAVIFPEGYLNENLQQACILAKEYDTMLIGGYRRLHETPKDRAILINRAGDIVLDRIKYSSTAFAVEDGIKIGHILCDELIVQGIKSDEATGIDLIVHPIGVGMFSEEQFDEWITAAKKIAIEYETMVIGTSQADGSFRNCGTSIPIAYGFGRDGKSILYLRMMCALSSWILS